MPSRLAERAPHYKLLNVCASSNGITGSDCGPASNKLTDKVPALIYFTSRATAENIASILTQRLANREVAFYHGGMEQVDRISIQQQFMNDQLDIICCTSAFGMGINKSNIRLIIHFHIPLQLEAYIQEVGRAGRDGKSSVGILLFSPRDAIIPNHIIQNEHAVVLTRVTEDTVTIMDPLQGNVTHDKIKFFKSFESLGNMAVTLY